MFVDGELAGSRVTTAHRLDLGAPPRHLRDRRRGGHLRRGPVLNAIKVEEQGRQVDSAWRMIADNTRIPQMVIGDMEAQVAAASSAAPDTWS